VSDYYGVTAGVHASKKRWKAQIRYSGKQRDLGTFATK
jgi:hypothetical protein